MTFTERNPADTFLDVKGVAQALGEAIVDGDKEAFQEILEAFVKVQKIQTVAKATGLNRSMIYDVIDKRKNPSLDSVFKLVAAFKKVVQLKKKTAVLPIL